MSSPNFFGVGGVSSGARCCAAATATKAMLSKESSLWPLIQLPTQYVSHGEVWTLLRKETILVFAKVLWRRRRQRRRALLCGRCSTTTAGTIRLAAVLAEVLWSRRRQRRRLLLPCWWCSGRRRRCCSGRCSGLGGGLQGAHVTVEAAALAAGAAATAAAVGVVSR